MSGHDSKYFSTTKKGEIPELKEELNSQYKVLLSSSWFIHSVTDLWSAIFARFSSISSVIRYNL